MRFRRCLCERKSTDQVAVTAMPSACTPTQGYETMAPEIHTFATYECSDTHANTVSGLRDAAFAADD